MHSATFPTISLLFGAVSFVSKPLSFQPSPAHHCHCLDEVPDVDIISDVGRPELFQRLSFSFFVPCSILVRATAKLRFLASENSVMVTHSYALKGACRPSSLPIAGAGSRLQNMECKTSCLEAQAAETHTSLFRARSSTTPGACHIRQP